MPTKPKKPCRHPLCPTLTHATYCEQHAKLHESERRSGAARGYDARWQRARVRFLCLNPWCRKCFKQNKLVRATVVDHIVPHRGDKKLFWDESNWQPLCKPCHDKKTRTKDSKPVYEY